MITYQATQKIQELLDKLESNSSLLNFFQLSINIFSDVSKELYSLIDIPSINSSILESEHNSIQDIFIENGKRLKSFSFRSIFVDINVTDSVVTELVQILADPNSLRLKIDLQFFEEAYDNFIRSNTFSSVLNVILRSNRLYSSYSSTTDSLKSVLKLLETQKVEFDNEVATMSLLLFREFNFAEFVNKVASINEMYSELCRLLDVSTSQHPLKIIKVESGSLWLKVFGESQVIKLLSELIRDGVNYLYKKFTVEGQFTARIEAVEDVLQLESKIKASGIDTTEMQENIQLAGAKIAKNLNKLLEGESKITVNKETYSVGDALELKYLEASGTPLLKADNENSQQENDS